MLGRVQHKKTTELGSTVAADWSVGPCGYGSTTPQGEGHKPTILTKSAAVRLFR